MKKVTSKLFLLFVVLALVAMSGCSSQPKLADIKNASRGHYATSSFGAHVVITDDTVTYMGAVYDITDEERKDGTLTVYDKNHWSETYSSLKLICGDDLYVTTSMSYSGHFGIEGATLYLLDSDQEVKDCIYLEYVSAKESDFNKKFQKYKTETINKYKNKNWLYKDFFCYNVKSSYSPITVKFTDDALILDDVSYTISADDVLVSGDYEKLTKKLSDKDLYIKKGSDYITFDYYRAETRIPYGSIEPENHDVCKIDGNQYVAVSDGYTPGSGNSSDNDNDDDADDNSNSSASLADYNGKYSFKKAQAPQMNGSITLKDGKWSYSGDKTSPAAKDGTYTLKGSTFTFKWTAAGMEITEEFTIENNGSSSVWKSKAMGTSTLFSMLFGVVSTEMTFEL